MAKDLTTPCSALKYKDKQGTIVSIPLVGSERTLINALLDGSATEISCPSLGVTSLKSYRFNEFTNLQKLDLTGIHEIPEYLCNGCTGLKELVLDENITSIGQYAFCECKNNAFNIEIVGNNTDIGARAFSECRFSKITGNFKNIGDYAFYNGSVASQLKQVHIKINGSLGSYAFANTHITFKDFILDASSNITSLGTYIFTRFGSGRHEPENNIFTFDFRNSTFTSVGSNSFAGYNASSKNIYFDIYFPTSCATINSSVFQYSDYFNIYYKNIPTLSNTNAFSNATNFKNFFPYNLVQTAKTSTNWSSTTYNIVNSIYGYSDVNEFVQGQQLPTTDSEGYALTWYSDREMITTVTTVTDATAMYYCSVGTKIASRLDLTQFQATCTVSDGTNTYVDGDRILVGTNLTITAVGTQGNPEPYIFTLNGSNITSGATYAVTDTNFSIVCIYYDGETAPVDPVFANNIPAQIKVAVDNGLHRALWNIGDEKQITMTDDTTWTLRYIDQQVNRYQKSDNSGYSNAVFEINPIIKTAKMNILNTNAGGWPASAMNTTTMAEIYDILPAEWKAVVSEVKIPSATSTGDPTIVTANNKVFIPSGQEIFANTSTNCYDEGCTRFDWYTTHNTNNDRIKKYNNTNTYWWLRSPYRVVSNGFCVVSSSGGSHQDAAASNNGVVACLAI